MKPALVIVLAASLALTAGVALWSDDEAASDLLPIRSKRAAQAVATVPRASTAQSTAPAPLPRIAAAVALPTASRLPTRAADWPAVDPGALAAWQGRPPAAALAVAAAGSAPARPPPAALAYQWIGQLDDGNGAPQVLLASPQRSVAVRLGGVLDQRWRIERASSGSLQAVNLATGDVVAVRGAPAAAAP